MYVDGRRVASQTALASSSNVNGQLLTWDRTLLKLSPRGDARAKHKADQ